MKRKFFSFIFFFIVFIFLTPLKNSAFATCSVGNFNPTPSGPVAGAYNIALSQAQTLSFDVTNTLAGHTYYAELVNPTTGNILLTSNQSATSDNQTLSFTLNFNSVPVNNYDLEVYQDTKMAINDCFQGLIFEITIFSATITPGLTGTITPSSCGSIGYPCCGDSFGLPECNTTQGAVTYCPNTSNPPSCTGVYCTPGGVCQTTGPDACTCAAAATPPGGGTCSKTGDTCCGGILTGWSCNNNLYPVSYGATCTCEVSPLGSPTPTWPWPSPPSVGPDVPVFTVTAPPGVPTGVTPTSVAAFILNLIVAIGIVAALVFLIYGGIKYVTSGGDKQAIEQARSHIIMAIAGLIVIILAFAIVGLVLAILGLPPLSLSFTIPTLSGK